jgi:hypothetical protein
MPWSHAGLARRAGHPPPQCLPHRRRYAAARGLLEQALAKGILIHFVALLRHAKNDTFIIIHFLLDASHRNSSVVIAKSAILFTKVLDS